jgi:hypothetical protein
VQVEYVVMCCLMQWWNRNGLPGGQYGRVQRRVDVESAWSLQDGVVYLR